MTYTSDRPISVDGVRLDTLAWNITKVNRATAARRTADVVVPGRDGAIPSLNDDLEPASMGLEMFVMGTDADGAVPGGSRRDLFRQNLDELVHLFGKRHALLEVQEKVGGGVALTNDAQNPRFGTGATNTWSATGATTVASTDRSYLGTHSLKWTYTGASPASNAGPRVLAPFTPGHYKVAMLVWVPAGAPDVGLSLQAVTRTIVDNSQGNTAGRKDQWVWIRQTLDVTGSNLNASLYALNSAPTTADQVGGYVGAVLIAKVDPSTPLLEYPDYFDGDAPPDSEFTYHWTGEPHASPSVRRPASRRAMAKVQDAITPDVATTGSSGQFTVGLTIPAGVWEDAHLNDWTAPVTPYQVAEVTTLRGGTERVTDAVLLVVGPITSPSITDANTGAYVRLNKALAAGECWRVNVGTWSSRTGSGLTLDSPDAAGDDAQHLTEFGGTPNQAAFLPLVTVRDPVDPSPVGMDQDGTPYVTSQAGSGTVIAYDEDGVPYVTYLAETSGQAIAYDGSTPYLTGGGTISGGSPVRRTRVVVGGSGTTANTILSIRARRKWAL